MAEVVVGAAVVLVVVASDAGVRIFAVVSTEDMRKSGTVERAAVHVVGLPVAVDEAVVLFVLF